MALKILLVITHNGQSIDDQVHNAVTACLQLDVNYHAMVLGHDCQSVIDEARKMKGLQKLFFLEHVSLEFGLAEPSAESISQFISDYDYILFPSNTTSKNILPRLAALQNISPITDVCEIVDKDDRIFKRPIYAGNIIETVQSEQDINILSIRSASFTKTPISSEANVDIEHISPDLSSIQSKHLGCEITKLDRPDLVGAKVVVSGGRGLGSVESFQLIYDFADCLDAAVGASRAAVDAGFVSNDYQVGQTGKIIAPDVYYAIGISGAIQHMAGMKDSRIIIAINKDADAPIFKSCDYGLVADLFDVVPKLVKHLKK